MSTCPNCNGTSKQRLVVGCAKCLATGAVDGDPCSACRGKREIEIYLPCPRCNGPQLGAAEGADDAAVDATDVVETTFSGPRR